MSDDLARRVAELEAFHAQLRRVCPEAAEGLAIGGSKLPPQLSHAELTAILRMLPDRSGTAAFLDAWFAAGPAEVCDELSPEEEALRHAYAVELERVCPAAEWNEPPYGWDLLQGLAHATAVLRRLPAGIGPRAVYDALHAPPQGGARPDV